MGPNIFGDVPASPNFQHVPQLPQPPKGAQHIGEHLRCRTHITHGMNI